LRKIFNVGGILGLTFNKESIDLSQLKGVVLSVELPNKSIGFLKSIEVIFHKPDFSDPFDSSAHRASVVNFLFVNEHDEYSLFEVSGTYFWRFIESAPEPFKALPYDGLEDRYLNDSLENIMKLARKIYLSSFIPTTMENACSPPISCKYNFQEASCEVIEATTLPREESRIISSIIGQKIDSLILTGFVSKFVDKMLLDGYLTHSYEQEGKAITPVFTITKWDNEKHKVVNDYLSELSPYGAHDCPAYLIWRQILSNEIKIIAEKLFNKYFTLESIKGREDLKCAIDILSNNEDLFEIQGANESIDAIYKRTIIAMTQYLEALEKPH